MKKIKSLNSNRGAIPIIVWIAISCLVIGGSTGGVLGYLVGGGTTGAKGFAYGIGVGVILGILFIPNARRIIRRMKGIIYEIKR